MKEGLEYTASRAVDESLSDKGHVIKQQTGNGCQSNVDCRGPAKERVSSTVSTGLRILTKSFQSQHDGSDPQNRSRDRKYKV